MSEIDQGYANNFVDEETPNPYGTIPSYLQSPPTAVLGGANQGKRNWCSGPIRIPGSGGTWQQSFDTSFGEWVTVFWYPDNLIQGYIEEDGILRGFLPCNMLQYRRNGTLIKYSNGTVSAQTIVVTLSDYESRPVFA